MVNEGAMEITHEWVTQLPSRVGIILIVNTSGEATSGYNNIIATSDGNWVIHEWVISIAPEVYHSVTVLLI